MILSKALNNAVVRPPSKYTFIWVLVGSHFLIVIAEVLVEFFNVSRTKVSYISWLQGFTVIVLVELEFVLVAGVIFFCEV
jgi:hypothetical protein